MAPSKTFNIAGLHSAVAIVPDEAVRKRLCAAQAGLVHEPDILGYTPLWRPTAMASPGLRSWCAIWRRTATLRSSS